VALQRLLDDPDLGRRLGAAGLERVRSQFTADRMSGAAVALYHDVCGTRVPEPQVAAS
jgi:glycosyltransferase involved in cell wall biosynthesis